MLHLMDEHSTLNSMSEAASTLLDQLELMGRLGRAVKLIIAILQDAHAADSSSMYSKQHPKVCACYVSFVITGRRVVS